MSIEEHFREDMDINKVLESVEHHAATGLERGKYFKIAYSQLKVVQDAEDAVQEAYTRLLETEAKGHVIRDTAPYFTIVLRNCIRSVFNARRGIPDTDTEEGAGDYGVPDDQKEHLDDSFIREGQLEAIQKIVRRFSPMVQDVFILRYVYQHSNKEICEVLHVTKAAVKSALFRTRQAVRAELS